MDVAIDNVNAGGRNCKSIEDDEGGGKRQGDDTRR
jgi:hypothetical protein